MRSLFTELAEVKCLCARASTCDCRVKCFVKGLQHQGCDKPEETENLLRKHEERL